MLDRQAGEVQSFSRFTRLAGACGSTCGACRDRKHHLTRSFRHEKPLSTFGRDLFGGEWL
ncbi:hypothetical protein POI8812_02432 [Pontivivens insulae]|uniref:Uncharacterized protein n=1 Tax=Pontivivens insulae TaxID=1639689 RepID=A0A2R8AD57_9RHOB|nr:hypothetical protein DFR53_1379 [Pontivivens insulae]SPF30102.1 hypothetical protein POI8812_02432 [Pontivivens insulae]